MPGANLRDLFHPFRVFVRKLIHPVVFADRLIEAHHTFGEAGAGNAQVGAVRADGDGLCIGFDGPGEIFQAGLDTSENHRPAVVARRLLNCLGVVVHQLRLALVAGGKEGGFNDYVFVLRENVDDLHILVHRPGIVGEPSERRNQAAAKRGDTRFAFVRGKGCIAKQRDRVEIELLQPLLIARLSVGVSQSSEVLAVVGRIL